MTCMDVGNNAIFNDLIPDLDHGSEVVFCVLLSCDIHCIFAHKNAQTDNQTKNKVQNMQKNRKVF